MAAATISPVESEDWYSMKPLLLPAVARRITNSGVFGSDHEQGTSPEVALCSKQERYLH
jgi:hypothetical protein